MAAQNLWTAARDRYVWLHFNKLPVLGPRGYCLPSSATPADGISGVAGPIQNDRSGKKHVQICRDG
jgi:hypothetical protein